MTVNWGSYELIDLEVVGSWSELSPAQARRSFEKIMTQRHDRITMLGNLVQANGYPFGSEDSQLQAVNDFFRLNVEAGDGLQGYPAPEWGSVAYDIGLHLGEVLINRFPNLRWELDTTKRSTSVNQPVLVGFSKAHPRFNLPVFDRFISYGYQVLREVSERAALDVTGSQVRSAPIDKSLLLRLVETATQYA